MELLREVRFAVRALRRAPGFTSTVLLILTLGIGGTVAIFSLLNALLLRPLPFRDEAQLVRMRDETRRVGQEPYLYSSSPRSFFAMRERAAFFESVTAQRLRTGTVSWGGEPQRVVAVGVAERWVATLGVQPIIGRPFSAQEEVAGPDAGAALVSYELWRTKLGGGSDALNKQVQLEGRQYTIVGVMPRNFNYPYNAQLWIPDRFDRNDGRPGLNVVARLRSGLTIEAGQQELDGLSQTLASEFPATHASVRLLAVPIRADLVSNHPRLAIALLSTATLLLLLACFNIANLLLMRLHARQREQAIRTALGATAGRRARERLVENLVLAGGGALLGMALASAVLRPLARLSLPADSSLGFFFTDLSLDARVAVFAIVAAVATAALCGFLPALRATRVDLATVMRAGGRGMVRGSTPGQSVLLACEIVAGLALLAAAGFMLRNMERLENRDLGYQPAGRVIVQLPFATAAGRDAEAARIVTLGSVIEAVQAIRGVQSSGAVNHLPAEDGSVTTTYSIEAGPGSDNNNRLVANLRSVGGDYFAALGVALRTGRTFTSDELNQTRAVAIVNSAFAQRYWPSDNALGHRIKLGTQDGPQPWFTVVGVVANVSENMEVPETIYVPYPQRPLGNMWILIDVGANADLVLPELRAAVRRVDPGLPTDRTLLLETMASNTLGPQRAATRLVAAFAIFGLLLAGLGIYGAVAFLIVQRRRELAVRRSVGATNVQIVCLAVRRATWPVLPALACGIPIALLLMRGLEIVLGGRAEGVSIETLLLAEGSRPVTSDLLAPALIIVGVALAAALIPSMRATRQAPLTVLSEEV